MVQRNVSSKQLAVNSQQLVISDQSVVISRQSAVGSQQLVDKKSPLVVSAAEPLGDLGAKVKSPLVEVGEPSRTTVGERSRTIGTKGGSPWLVVKTKIKCEKFVRDRLLSMGIEAFVPLRKRTAKYNRKVVTYEHPLISCYTFVRFDRERRNQVLALPYVQGMLRTDNKDCTVSEREIQWLQKVSGTELDIKTETLSLNIGEKVILAYGQLAGMEGTIISRHAKHEVAVALESLGLQMLIRIDPDMLEKKW